MQPDVVGHGPDHVGHVVRRTPEEDLRRVRPTWVSAVGLTVIEARTASYHSREYAAALSAIRRTFVSSVGVRSGCATGRGVGPSGQGLDEQLVLEMLVVHARSLDVVWYGLSRSPRKWASRPISGRAVEGRVGSGGVAGLLCLGPIAMELDGRGVVLGDPLDGAATDAPSR